MSYMSSIFHDGDWSDLPGACFATREEAEGFNFDLRFNGPATNTRVVETDKPVSSRYKDHQLFMGKRKTPINTISRMPPTGGTQWN